MMEAMMPMMHQLLRKQLSGGGMLASFYRDLTNSSRSQNDLVYTPTSATNYSVDQFVIAKNITVGTNATLQFPNGPNVGFLVCDTLTLEGRIMAGLANNGGTQSSTTAGQGGSGSGTLVVIARQIIGSGSITSNGANGGNGVVPGTANRPGVSGGGARYFSQTNTGGEGIASVSLVSYTAGGPSLGIHKIFLAHPNWLYNSMENNLHIHSAGGGTGSQDGDASSNTHSGGGGGSLVAAGGGGAVSTSNAYMGSGGGGAGAAGYLIVISENPNPSISLQSRGGLGGNGFGNAGGGGGGGAGGVIIEFAPASSATKDVAGGLPGSAGGAYGGTASAGGNGFALHSYFSA